MAICKFYQTRDGCRNGSECYPLCASLEARGAIQLKSAFLTDCLNFKDNCRFEHPGANSAGNASRNRFAPLSGGSNRFGGGRNPEYFISTTEFTNDLTEGKGRPKWLLSSWGPREGPRGFFEDYSPEEVRWRFYELAAQGKEGEADQEAITLWNNADSQMRQLASRVDDIGDMMREAEKQHPNRWDFLKMDGTKTREQVISEAQGMNANSGNSPFGSTGASSGFGSTPNAASNPFSKPATSTFGQATQPSIFGAGSSTFGKPAFGSTGFGGSSSSSPFGQAASGGTFGQPSQPTSTFGKPSQPASTFGQPSQPTSTFGQASQPSSTFGQPSQPSSAFGSTGFGGATQKNPFAAASASSGFGQSNLTFGQSSQPTSTFGHPSQPNSTFGQPSQPSSTFGQPSQPSSTFGQPAQPSSAFGQPSQPTPTFGQPAQQASPFGQSSQTNSTFGKPTAFGQAASPFGQSGQTTSSFGQPSQTTSTFGQPSQPSSGFTQPTFGASATPSFGQPSTQGNAFGGNTTQQQPSDQAMETNSPGASPRAIPPGNQFANAATPTFTSPMPAPSAPSQPVAPPPPPKAIVNTSSTPHPLTGKPPAAVLVTQSLPFQPPQKNRDQLISYRGQRVQYVDGEPCFQRPDRKGLQKIWFPDGAAAPDVVALNREDKLDDLQGSPDEYTDSIKEQYKYFFDNGSFQHGKIPLVPPMREWAVYDF
ncbi:uncharacterized protein A1O9_00793 [Exophiala aquamarina CBS 119918]|uniref:C3H1-type domain-containing protein n=1 Tax=Exophiala aquamarina CBS 119918 TaxID=1182545 RepID=A0A072Q4K6_9EURO|nr:uncharacterized protein A1O9_00793 [Exophiala aquamarina CBS 119918]KEF62820.1 hypothetical protein A1O9_00793 [Exophiala aquamarina CBS 119918]